VRPETEYTARRAGVAGRLFADPQPTPEETSFQVDNTSQQYFDSPYYRRHKDDLQPVPGPSSARPRLDLADVVDAASLAAIQKASRISFHAVGDTGAAKVNPLQDAARAIANEASVADAMTNDVRRGGPRAPAFFFHLGDVVYYFGEGRYYYDQFYEPFRGYDRPIFAIPGNHDGMVYGSGRDTPDTKTLTAFLRNFCAKTPAQSPDAGTIMRSTMTQPGVYFTLDAPFVSIIGLYTNVLEGPGVISTQNGAYPAVDDDQLDFLTAELERLSAERKRLERAVIIACHHPPASVDSSHGGTTGLAEDLDRACRSAGLWPDAILSGHAHLYQRFTRRTAGRQVPYVVAGSGGFAATKPKAGLPRAPITVGEYTLVKDPIVEFGYLTVTVTMTAKPKLEIRFNDRTNTKIHDAVTVDLTTGKLR
jgi:hypothetical protein